MKKFVNIFLVVFLLFSFVSVPNVYADESTNNNPSNTTNLTKSNNSSAVSENGDLPTFLEDDDTTYCGKIKRIPKYIPFISSLTITVLTIISMGMLVIMGTIDLFKGTVSGKEDEIKKNQKAFIGRLTSAIIIFLLVALTKLFVGLVGNAMGTTNGIADCIDLFINNR